MSDPSSPASSEHPHDGAAADASAPPQAAAPSPDAAAPAAPMWVQPYPGAPPQRVDAAAAPPAPAAPLPPYAAAASGHPGAIPAYPGAPAPTPAAPTAPPYATAPPAGHLPPGAPPAYGPGAGAPRTPDTRPKTLAIIALALAVAGGIGVFIPFVVWGAVPLLLGAIVLAIISLVLRSQGGTGLSIAALIVSVGSGLMSIIVAVVTTLFFAFGTFGAFSEGPGGGTGGDPGDSEDLYVDPYGSPYGEVLGTGAEQELQVVETAFGASAYEDGSWWFTVVIENPNDDAVFDYEEIGIDALDAGGAVVDDAYEYRAVTPGTTAVTGYFYDLNGAAVASLDVHLPDAADAVIVDPAGIGTLRVDGVSAANSDGTTVITGTVTNGMTEDLDYVGVAVVARDASGVIIMAETTYAEAVAAGGTGAFETWIYPELTDGSSFEAYPFL